MIFRMPCEIWSTKGRENRYKSYWYREVREKLCPVLYRSPTGSTVIGEELGKAGL
jgi:hypothetical protein